jgi:hypothetical protein
MLLYGLKTLDELSKTTSIEWIESLSQTLEDSRFLDGNLSRYAEQAALSLAARGVCGSAIILLG